MARPNSIYNLSFIIVAIGSLLFTNCQTPSSKLDTKAVINPFDSLNALIKESPNEPNLYFERAKLHYVARDLPSSLSDVGRALKLDSTNTDYLIMLADLKLLERQSKESLDALLKAYAINPQNITVLLKLGELYMIVQDADASFKYLNEALKIDVYNATAYRLKGFNYKYLGDTVNCLSSFQTAIENDPEDFDSYMQLGLLYSKPRLDMALDYLNNALKVRPTSIEALYAKGMYLQSVGRSRDALDSYDAILKLNPSYFNAYYNKGYIYLEQLEKFDSAAYQFNLAIDNGPENYVDAIFNRGLSYERSNQMQKAADDYKLALKINPQYDNAAIGLSRLED